MRLEVRCCCQPQKLLGTIDVPGIPYAGMGVTWAMGVTISSVAPLGPQCPVNYERRSLRLYVERFVPISSAPSYLAVKAEGVGLDVLRLVPSFQESNDAMP